MSKRDYPFGDTVLLEWGDTVAEYLKQDIAVFSSFDKKLNQDFLENVQKQVDEAFLEGGDTLNRTQLRKKTEAVEKAMQACYGYHRRLKYWVLDAFPDKKAIQKQFGIGQFSKIRDNQVKMIQYMEGLKDTIGQYQAELETAGASKDLLQQIEVLSELLRTANKEQEQKKGTRAVDTAGRVERLNDLYALLRKISAAADIVFEDQPAKRDLYSTPYKTVARIDTDQDK